MVNQVDSFISHLDWSDDSKHICSNSGDYEERLSKILKNRDSRSNFYFGSSKKRKNVTTKEMHFSAIILWKLSCLRSSLSTTEKHWTWLVYNQVSNWSGRWRRASRSRSRRQWSTRPGRRRIALSGSTISAFGQKERTGRTSTQLAGEKKIRDLNSYERINSKWNLHPARSSNLAHVDFFATALTNLWRQNLTLAGKITNWLSPWNSLKIDYAKLKARSEASRQNISKVTFWREASLRVLSSLRFAILS